jgi:hypothetical protein
LYTQYKGVIKIHMTLKRMSIAAILERRALLCSLTGNRMRYQARSIEESAFAGRLLVDRLGVKPRAQSPGS